MKTERELFEEWYEQNKDSYLKYGNNYGDFAFKAWQASANREGYKLVPVEPTEEMLDASRRRQWDDLSSPYEDMDMLKYKAMINAI